jgi:hypothetical protein
MGRLKFREGSDLDVGGFLEFEVFVYICVIWS